MKVWWPRVCQKWSRKEYKGGSCKASRTVVGSCERGAVATQNSMASSNQSGWVVRVRRRRAKATSRSRMIINRVGQLVVDCVISCLGCFLRFGAVG